MDNLIFAYITSVNEFYTRNEYIRQQLNFYLRGSGVSLLVTTASRRAAPHSIAPHRTAIIVPQVNINFLMVDGANSMRQRRGAAVCGLQRQSFGHEVGNNDDAGLGLHFPRSRKVPFGPGPGPGQTELHYRLISFALHAARLPFSVRLSRSITRYPRKTMQRDSEYQADKTVGPLAATKMKKSSRDELRVSLPA